MDLQSYGQNADAYTAPASSFLPVFPYVALVRQRQQLRLLKFLPHTWHEGSIVHAITLQVFDQDTAPTYTALSYEWGGTDDMKPVKIGSGYIWIRRNLHDFIEHYHDMGDTEKYFWIDQICIDQQNVDEKNRQVARMAQIYSSAEEVLVWLGPCEQAKIAFEAVTIALEAFHSDPSVCDAWATMPTARNVFSAAQKEEVIRLHDLPYWRRQWIAQEIALARKCTIIYGRETYPWHDLGFLNHYRDSHSDNFKAFWHSLGIRNSFEHFHWITRMSTADQSHLKSWFPAMLYAKRSICSNPRDKVFGIQSVFPKELRVNVDYSLSAREVFAQAAWSYLRTVDLSVDTVNEGIEKLAEGMGILVHTPERQDWSRRDSRELWLYCRSNCEGFSELERRKFVFDIILDELLSGNRNPKLSDVWRIFEQEPEDRSRQGDLLQRLLTSDAPIDLCHEPIILESE